MIKKFIHTSDWHIGRKLRDFERYEEFRKFFQWLEDLINTEEIDALLVSGDIFDNTTPSVKAQEIYYSFLAKISQSHCRHVIIISGNHDSPAFLDAPAELLNLINIQVIGTACENEIITLYDTDKNPEMIVCAVPYLRDRDVRTLGSGDSYENIDRDLINGINFHYAKVFDEAKILSDKNKNIPVVATGHLFTHGGITKPDDGVRSLYVGTSIEIQSEIFPEFLTYTALGHLHSAQKIKRENIRYSGSPIQMDFGEAGQQKSVYIIELDGKNLINIRDVKIPIFKRLERISGDFDELCAEIQTFQNESVWLDVTYTGEETIGNLSDRIKDFVKAFSNVEILSIRDNKTAAESDGINNQAKSIDDITPLGMLDLFFDEKKIADDKREIFAKMYEEILLKAEIEE